MNKLLWLFIIFMLNDLIFWLLMWWWVLLINLILNKSALTTFFLLSTFMPWHFLHESLCHTCFIISRCWIHFVKRWIKLWNLLLWLWVHSFRLEKIYWCFVCWTNWWLCFWTVCKRWLFFRHKFACCNTWEISFLLSWLASKSWCSFFKYFWWVNTLLFTDS